MEFAAQTDEKSARMVIAMDGSSMRCSGFWIIREIAQLEAHLTQITWPETGDLVFDCSALSALDTSGAWLLQRTVHELEARGQKVMFIGLRPEFDALLHLITSSTIKSQTPPPALPNLLARMGRQSWRGLHGLYGMLSFVGVTAIILMHSLTQPHRIRWRAILRNLQTAGFQALPIVGLLSFLMGLVISYQGADQLQRFGANIFIADLVGLSMLRELSPLLAAIIVAGRSGSSYAAQIGTMKVTEEIDALRTIGVGPTELLVLPKLVALVIALPLLTVYADITGVFGGMIMARSKLDVSFDVFLDRLGDAVSLSSFLTGIGKAPVFAAIIALVGCYQGFQVTGSADSVGRQTTMSVVQAIFLVILSDALFSIVFNWLKI